MERTDNTALENRPEAFSGHTSDNIAFAADSAHDWSFAGTVPRVPPPPPRLFQCLFLASANESLIARFVRPRTPIKRVVV